MSGPFRVANARAAGISKKRLRAQDLIRPFHGMRAPAGGSQDVLDRADAAAVLMRPDRFFSHATAAQLYGLPLPSRVRTDLVHIASPRPQRASRRTGVVGHSIDGERVTVVHVDGLRTVHPVDAWCQLAGSLTLRELVVMGDALMRRHEPLATREELEQAVARFRHGRGRRRLLEALVHVRPRTDSPPETELRLDIVAFGLPEPQINVEIRSSPGVLIAIVDLLFSQYKVVVEYDGEQHRIDDQQYARDVQRLDDLAGAGYRVIRVHKQHRGPRRREVLATIRAALIDRGWTTAP